MSTTDDEFHVHAVARPTASAHLKADCPRSTIQIDTFETAWKDVAAALPAGWSFRLHRMPSARITITARNEKDQPWITTDFEDTPTAALRSLAVLLRERERDARR